MTDIHPNHQGTRQTPWILGFALILLGLWSLVLNALPWRAHIAESNYQSNLIRLEHALLNPATPNAALVGSSITGRLLPEYFKDSNLPQIANLGLDGSGPLIGLELLASRSNIPPILLIEANLLMVPEGVNDRTLRNAVDGLGFQLARHAPILRAESRPSSLLYAWLKRRKDRSELDTAAPISSPATTSPQQPTQQETRMDLNTPEELASHSNRVYTLCRQLQNRGIRITLVRFPTQAIPIQTQFHPLDFTGDLARQLGVQRIDLGQEFQRIGHAPSFTDGTHLSPSSAHRAAQTLAQLTTSTVTAPKPTP
jgi:hypothetical protein